jgi:hypothetical protein
VRNGRILFGAIHKATLLVVACAMGAAGGVVANSAEQKTRTLTRQEVFAAIERTLRANGSPAGEALGAADVQMSGEVQVTESAPRLQVTQIQTAPDGATSRVLIWVASEPRVPPFWVRVSRRMDLGGSTHVAGSSEASMQTAHAPQQIAVVAVTEHPARVAATRVNTTLVKAGDPVALIVEVGGLRIQGTGIPLDRGARGDEVRVRALPSGRVVVGMVTAEQTVQVTF